MSKMTLLEMVQNIASAIESDDVNSISDTVESYQIAREIQTAYDELVRVLDIPSNDSLILLDGLGDTSHPNYLKLPSTVKQVLWFKYDRRSSGQVGDYVPVTFLPPEDFVIHAVGNGPVDGSTTVVDFSGASLPVLTDKEPTYWTSFDNTYIVTDSYNSAIDSTLQQSKSLCFGQNNVSFILSDSYIPVLDDDLFPLLLAESKSACFANIKQIPSAKDEQRAHRQLVRAQNDLYRANQRRPYERTPNYGR